MCTYAYLSFCDNISQIFSSHPHVPGTCLWEIWLGYCAFFFFSNQTLWRVETHTMTVWRMKVQVCNVPAALCHPWLSFHEGKAGSARWQPADTCTPTQDRASSTLEWELHTETFLTIPHSVPSLFCSLGLTACSHSVLFLLIKHFKAMPGLCSPIPTEHKGGERTQLGTGRWQKRNKEAALAFCRCFS